MSKPVRILIADPNPFVRSFLSRELTAAGYQTAEAGTCREIFNQINTAQPPALLIMELDFPIISGMNVLQRIQNLVPTMPHIIYTHLTEYENCLEAKKADAFVEKNDDPDELFQAIDAVLVRYQPSKLPRQL
jgi:DNA-binding NtrC family response regulator